MEQDKKAAPSKSRAISDFDGAKLQVLRTQVRMLSQVQLADAAGLSRGEISHLETAKRKPLATTLKRLCVALECEPGDLLTHSRPAGRRWETAKDDHAIKKEAVSA